MTTDNGDAAGASSTASGESPVNTPQTNADGTRVDPNKGAQGDFTVPDDLVQWGKSKGYDDLADLAKSNPTAYKLATSYRQAERMLGGDKIIMPKDAEDAEGWNAAYEKLGRPKEASGYDFGLPADADTSAADFMKPYLHKAGLNQQGANVLVQALNDFKVQLDEKTATENTAKATADKVDLEKEWGADFTKNEEGSRRVWREGMKAVGVDGAQADKMLEALQQTAGLKNTMKFMNWINGFAKTTEDTFEGDGVGTRSGGAMAVGTAQQRKDALLKDPSFAKRYNAKDSKAISEIRDLNNVIAAGRVTDSY